MATNKWNDHRPWQAPALYLRIVKSHCRSNYSASHWYWKPWFQDNRTVVLNPGPSVVVCACDCFQKLYELPQQEMSTQYGEGKGRGWGRRVAPHLSYIVGGTSWLPNSSFPTWLLEQPLLCYWHVSNGQGHPFSLVVHASQWISGAW